MNSTMAIIAAWSWGSTGGMLSAGGCSGAGATGSRSGKCGGVSQSLSCDMAEASVVVGGMEDGDEMVTRGAVTEGFILLLVS